MKKLLFAIWKLFYGHARGLVGDGVYVRPIAWGEINRKWLNGAIAIMETPNLGRWVIKTEGWIPSQHNPHSVFQAFGWPLDESGRKWATGNGLFYSCYPGQTNRYRMGEDFEIDHIPGQMVLDKKEVWPTPGPRAKQAEFNAVSVLQGLMAKELGCDAFVDRIAAMQGQEEIELIDAIPGFGRPGLLRRLRRKLKRSIWKSPALAACSAVHNLDGK